MATAQVLPDADVTTSWVSTGQPTGSTGTTYWDEINEPVDAATDATYIETDTLGVDFEVNLTASPAATSEVTQVDVNLRGVLTDVSATARFQIDLFTGATPLTGNPKYVTGANLGGYGTAESNFTLTWSGDMGGSGTAGALTKAEADDLRVRGSLLGT